MFFCCAHIYFPISFNHQFSFGFPILFVFAIISIIVVVVDADDDYVVDDDDGDDGVLWRYNKI